MASRCKRFKTLPRARLTLVEVAVNPWPGGYRANGGCVAPTPGEGGTDTSATCTTQGRALAPNNRYGTFPLDVPGGQHTGTKGAAERSGTKPRCDTERVAHPEKGVTSGTVAAGRALRGGSGGRTPFGAGVRKVTAGANARLPLRETHRLRGRQPSHY